jgi:hypothetical protein
VTCLSIGAGVVICRSDNRHLRRRVVRCPICQSMEEMVVQFEGWHSPTVMCTGCGDSWQDGELCYRPFARGWRKREVERYRALWDIATHGPAPSFEELFGEAQARPEILVLHLPEPADVAGGENGDK